MAGSHPPTWFKNKRGKARLYQHDSGHKMQRPALARAKALRQKGALARVRHSVGAWFVYTRPR